jgi:probable rRNA maturation factor
VTVTLLDQTRSLKSSEIDWISDQFKACLRVLDAKGEVRLALIGDDRMADAHERYSGVSGTTDVLTFDLRDDATHPLDTDLLLCVDEARRQATARGHSTPRELLLYALHGVLHCLGEDDHDPDAARRMHAREDEVLSAIGVGVTYSVDERVAPGGGQAGGAAE